MNRFIFTPTILILIILFLTACENIVEACQNPSLDSPKPSTLPNYISNIWPRPNSEISLGCYQEALASESPIGKGIGVGLRTGYIDTFSNEVGYTPLPTRINLVVDGKEIPKDNFELLDSGLELILLNNLISEDDDIATGVSTGYDFSWSIALSEGNHQAKVLITRDNGEILEYEWEFVIIR